jgi:hypothetical protein
VDVAVIQSLYRKDEVKDFVAEYGQETSARPLPSAGTACALAVAESGDSRKSRT